LVYPECAVDLDDYMKSGLIGKLFDCDSNGNYKVTTDPPAPVMTDGPVVTAAPVAASTLGAVLTGNIPINGESSWNNNTRNYSGISAT